jgi:hypothetical protein
MEVLLAILIVAAVAAFVAVPLRRARGEHEAEDAAHEAVVADLEARKQAKYREIRDTELDRAAGKIGTEEFERQDAELRAEAIAILKEIDAVARMDAKRLAEERPQEAEKRPPGPANP